MKEKIDYRLLKNYTDGRYSCRDFKRVASWFGDECLCSELESAINRHWNEFPESR